jgi:uncharacterized oxidoreductase
VAHVEFFTANIRNANTHRAYARARSRSARPGPGFEEVLTPGEPEKRHAAERSEQGIEVDDTTWRDNRAAAAETLGISAAEFDQTVGSNRG